MSNESEADEAADGAEEQAAETQADDVEATETEESEAGTEETEAGTESEETGLQRGDFVTIAYTARTVEDGTLVDTTDPEVAEEEGVGEDQEFAPRTIVIGEGHVFGAVEDDLVGKEVGDTGTVTVAAAEAFGEFDEDEVRTISTDRIPE
ncbi:hypothetical protein BRC78_00295, partial [Halobacteriales archaeon QH_8_68_33]